MIPLLRMDAANSCKRSASNTRLGCTGLASISSMRTLVGFCGTGGGVAAGSMFWGGLEGSSAVSPLPRALRGASGALFIGEYLLGQLDITFRSFGPDVIA